LLILQAHQNYVEHTDTSSKHFKKLVKKDKMLARQIEAQKAKIGRLQVGQANQPHTVLGTADVLVQLIA